MPMFQFLLSSASQSQWHFSFWYCHATEWTGAGYKELGGHIRELGGHIREPGQLISADRRDIPYYMVSCRKLENCEELISGAAEKHIICFPMQNYVSLNIRKADFILQSTAVDAEKNRLEAEYKAASVELRASEVSISVNSGKSTMKLRSVKAFIV